jgi:hypothetical protein
MRWSSSVTTPVADAPTVSAERLAESLRLLRATAATLDDAGGASRAAVALPSNLAAKAQTAPEVPAAPHTTVKVVIGTVARTAAVIAALAATCVLADPLMPRPDRPALADHVEASPAEGQPLPGLPSLTELRP